jgi:hypothetical protein
MLIVLKLASFTIWFIIMIFIIRGVFRKKRKSIRAFTPQVFNKVEKQSELCSEREKV